MHDDIEGAGAAGSKFADKRITLAEVMQGPLYSIEYYVQELSKISRCAVI